MKITRFLVEFAACAGLLVGAAQSVEAPLRVAGGRFLTLNTVIRVNQIESARDRNVGKDEAAIHTPETVARSATPCPPVVRTRR